MNKLGLALAALLSGLLIVLALWPDLDLDLARLFYVGPDHFVGNTPTGVVVRYAAWALPFVIFIAMLIAGLLGRLGRISPRWTPRGRSLVFATLSLAIAPGALVHATLKEISHRPRPYSLTEFGGHVTFRPFYKFDGACPHNCAFPSGETAAATWMLAPAGLVPAPWRGAALAAAAIFAAATGVFRMAFGAHFLSDVCGAALITILVILAMRLLVVGRRDKK